MGSGTNEREVVARKWKKEEKNKQKTLYRYKIETERKTKTKMAHIYHFIIIIRFWNGTTVSRARVFVYSIQLQSTAEKRWRKKQYVRLDAKH